MSPSTYAAFMSALNCVLAGGWYFVGRHDMRRKMIRDGFTTAGMVGDLAGMYAMLTLRVASLEETREWLVNGKDTEL